MDRTNMINTKTIYLMSAAVLSVSLGSVSNAVLPITAASPDSDVGNNNTAGAGGSDSDKVEVKEKEEDRGGGDTALQDETTPAATSELLKCDGSFQDCVTANGDICKAGQGGHECECVEDMSDCPNHPSLTEEPAANTTEGFVEGGPDGDCLFNPSLPKCASDNGECPDGFFQNEDGNCFPQHGRCPEGYHSHENDETGRCIPDSTPCEPGYIIGPDFPTCSQKERVCSNHPELKLCGGKGGGAGDDGNSNGNDNDDKNVIIKNIKLHFMASSSF
jgi:hypothetical protein